MKLNGEICLFPFLPFTLTVFMFNQSEQLIRTCTSIFLISNVWLITLTTGGGISLQLICCHKTRLKYNTLEQMMFALVGVRRQRRPWEVSGAMGNQEQDTGIKVTDIVALREKWLAGIWGVFLDERPVLKEDTGLLSLGSVTQVQSLNVPALSL